MPFGTLLLSRSKRLQFCKFGLPCGRNRLYHRPFVPGGAEGPPDFCRSVNPISTKGGRLCQPNNTGTPGFSDLPTALYCALLTNLQI